MLDECLLSAVTRVSRRCERVRPRAGFKTTFAMAVLPPPMYGQYPAISRAEDSTTHSRIWLGEPPPGRKNRAEWAKIHPFQCAL